MLKVSHNGSDSSGSPAFFAALDPEVAIISTKYTAGDKLPKKITLKQFQENRCYTLITGDGHDPTTGDFEHSPHTTLDDPGNFSVDGNAVFNDQGDVTVLVSGEGSRHTVVGRGFDKTFSAVDGENRR